MNEGELHGVQVSEQTAETLVDFAMIIGRYYTALIHNGVPEKLAHELTRGYHHMFWRTINDRNTGGSDG